MTLPVCRNVTPVPDATGAIVHISDCYSPRTGGIETQVAALVDAQRLRGRTVEVITATRGSSENGVHRIVVPVPFDLPIHPRSRHQIAKTLIELDPDVVHIHLGATSPFAWGAMRACRDLGLPAVITVHSMWGPIARTGYQRLINAATAAGFQWSAVSEVAAQSVERAVNRPVTVLPNGIDVDEWMCETSEADHLRVISVLRLAPRKRVIPLLRAFESAQTAVPSMHLTLIGDGPLRRIAQRYAEKHSLNVTFAGRQNHEQIKRAFADSDVFIQASIQESFGIAALEARSAGIPVIARKESGSSSFITSGIDGYLVVSDAELALRLINLARGTEALRSLKFHNREHRPPFDWDLVVKESQLLYDRAKQDQF